MTSMTSNNLLALSSGLALACASLLSGSPGDPIGGSGLNWEMPTRGGIVVRNPGDTFTGTDSLPSRGSERAGISIGNAQYDLNRDGDVDQHDLALMFDLLGGDDERGDFDGNGSVDGADLQQLVRAWQ